VIRGLTRRQRSADSLVAAVQADESGHFRVAVPRVDVIVIAAALGFYPRRWVVRMPAFDSLHVELVQAPVAYGPDIVGFVPTPSRRPLKPPGCSPPDANTPAGAAAWAERLSQSDSSVEPIAGLQHLDSAAVVSRIEVVTSQATCLIARRWFRRVWPPNDRLRVYRLDGFLLVDQPGRNGKAVVDATLGPVRQYLP
jgi:hypothetical protein